MKTYFIKIEIKIVDPELKIIEFKFFKFNHLKISLLSFYHGNNFIFNILTY
jgi:hypothetical protein